MQKKLSEILKKEIESYKDVKYIERITFEQLKKISIKNNNSFLN